MTKDPKMVSADMIAIRKDQKLRLKELGKFGETWADIIERLLIFWDIGHNPKNLKMTVSELKKEAEMVEEDANRKARASDAYKIKRGVWPPKE